MGIPIDLHTRKKGRRAKRVRYEDDTATTTSSSSSSLVPEPARQLRRRNAMRRLIAAGDPDVPYVSNRPRRVAVGMRDSSSRWMPSHIRQGEQEIRELQERYERVRNSIGFDWGVTRARADAERDRERERNRLARRANELLDVNTWLAPPSRGDPVDDTRGMFPLVADAGSSSARDTDPWRTTERSSDNADTRRAANRHAVVVRDAGQRTWREVRLHTRDGHNGNDDERNEDHTDEAAGRVGTHDDTNNSLL